MLSDGFIVDFVCGFGDFVIFGVGGKMGLMLVMFVCCGMDVVGCVDDVVYVVFCFGDVVICECLEVVGVMVVLFDLIENDDFFMLFDVLNVVFMVGVKFGVVINVFWVWEVNVVLFDCVVCCYCDSVILVLLIGNVYFFLFVLFGGVFEEV